MNDREQINAFHEAIGAVIHRFRKEFDLPYSSAIGSLMIHVQELSNECLKESEEQE